MKIFDKRPLCLILCILLGGFVFFSTANEPFRIALLAIAMILCVCGIHYSIKRVKRLHISVVCSVVLLLSSLLSYLYFPRYFNAYERYDGEVSVVATARQVSVSEYGAAVSLECESIDGRSCGYKLRAYVSSYKYDGIEENDVLKITGRISDFENDSDFDTRTYYRSNGFSGELTDITSIQGVSEAAPTLEQKISSYRASICEWIIKGSGNIGGGLLSALLLGEREYLPVGMSNDFTRTGLSHTLALSGMHLAILSLALGKLLTLFRLKKKTRKIVEVVFVILYMALTGFPISVVRAGIMLIISSMLFLLASRSDSFTSLSISVAVIIAIQPYAIYDVSLWLSAFATLGVLTYVELTEADKYDKKKKPLARRVLNYLFASLAVSLFAIAFTMLISTLSYGTVSTIAPVSTLVASFLIRIFMYVGLFFILIGHLFGVGHVVEVFGSIIKSVIEAFSSLDNVYLSVEYVYVELAVFLLTFLIAAFLILDIKSKKPMLITMLSLVVFIFGSSYVTCLVTRSGADIEYALTDNDERILFKSDGEITVLDISDSSSAALYDAIEYVTEYGLYEIENYVFTGIGEELFYSAGRLAASLKVDKIYVPQALNAAEERIISALEVQFENLKSELIQYSADEFLFFGEFSYFPVYRSLLGDDEKLAFLLFENGNAITYLSSGMLEGKTKNVATTLMEGCDTLILGRHGKTYSNYEFILKYKGIKRIVLSSENLTIPSDILGYYADTEIITRRDKLSLIR